MPKKIDLGPTGETVRRNVQRLREDQNLTFAELARRLQVVGNPIPSLGLRRIEAGERRIHVDDLLALCAVLQCTPDYLLIDQEGGTPQAQTELTGFGKFTTIGAWVLLNHGQIVRRGRATALHHQPDYQVSAEIREKLEKDGLELPEHGDD